MALIQHSSVLTADEHAKVPLHPEFKRRIRELQSGGRSPRILDWGCGRGSDVLHLRQQGLDAYGAEPSQETIDRGRELFISSGIDHQSVIRLISPDNSTSFESATFDLIMSYQVLEHVADMDSAAAEMSRLLKPGALAVHLYPGHRRPVEGHLHMPFVHWLPKNNLRYGAIRGLTALGVEPRWSTVAGKPAQARARRYFKYSCESTYYRSPGEVRRIFQRAGLAVGFESHRHERIRKMGVDRVVPAPVLGWLLNNFVGVVLICRKPLS